MLGETQASRDRRWTLKSNHLHVSIVITTTINIMVRSTACTLVSDVANRMVAPDVANRMVAPAPSRIPDPPL